MCLSENDVSACRDEEEYAFQPEAPRQYGRNFLIRKTFAVLRSFRAANEQLTSLDIAQRAQIPKSSGHRIVATLEEIGILSRGPRGRYQPGILLASLAHSVDINQALCDASREVIRELAADLNLDVYISRLQDGVVFCIAEACAPGAPLAPSAVGTCFSPFTSGPGKILLTAFSDERLERFLYASRQFGVRWHVPDFEATRHDLEQIGALGFAIDDLPCERRLLQMAVPITDGNGRVLAALSVQGATDQLRSWADSGAPDQLRAAAAAIRKNASPA